MDAYQMLAFELYAHQTHAHEVSEKGAESGAFCRRFLLPLHPR
jgi:hypothetical protein